MDAHRLSVVSVAIMLERAWFYVSLRDDLPELASRLRDTLRKGDLAVRHRRIWKLRPAPRQRVVVAGLLEADRGAQAAEEAMAGAKALQKIRLERRLAYLGYPR